MKQLMMTVGCVAVCMLAASAAVADTTPVMLSFGDPFQVPSAKYDVAGLNCTLGAGKCHDLSGLDLGIASCVSGDFKGVSVCGIQGITIGQMRGVHIEGLSSEVFDSVYGVQIGGLRSVSRKGDLFGLQIGGVLSGTSNSVYGVQIAGFGNKVKAGDVCGVQIAGIMNATANNLSGVQIAGVVNMAGCMNGLQIGLLNLADRVECGLQIGLFNVINDNGWATVLPIVNGHF